MAKPELGTKHVCISCAAKFYDLGKQPPVCPKCGTEQPVEQPRPRKPAGNVAEDKRPVKAAPAPGLEDSDVDVDAADDDDDSDEDVLEDASELEDGADDIGDVEVETERSDDDH